MKWPELMNDRFKEEFPIVLQMVRDMSVDTFTKTEFTDVWNKVATVEVSDTFIYKKLNELCELGLLKREKVRGTFHYR